MTINDRRGLVTKVLFPSDNQKTFFWKTGFTQGETMASTLAEFTNGELVKLVTEDWIGRVTAGITDSIAQSFETDIVLRPVNTRNEINRRFEICIKWFVTLRRELGWAVPHILDEMPKILRDELDCGGYEPDEKRKAWHGEGVEGVLVEDGEDMAPETPDIDAKEVEHLLD